MVKEGALLENDADFNKQTKDDWTPLMYASHKGVGPQRLYILRMLLENGADRNIQTKDGWTALMKASRRGQTETVKTLIKAPSIDVNVQNNDNKGHCDRTCCCYIK